MSCELRSEMKPISALIAPIATQAKQTVLRSQNDSCRCVGSSTDRTAYNVHANAAVARIQRSTSANRAPRHLGLVQMSERSGQRICSGISHWLNAGTTPCRLPLIGYGLH